MSSSVNAKRESLPTAGSVFFVSSTGSVLRLPIPSRSHRDPLTWSWTKRLLAFWALLTVSITSSFALNLPGLLIRAIRYEFNDKAASPFGVESLSSAMTLFHGLGILIGIPLSKALGRRPVVVIAAVITCLSILWAGLAGTFAELLVSVSFQALAAGFVTGMIVLILIDASFIHERPTVLTLFWCLDCCFMKLYTLVLPYTTNLEFTWRSVYQVWFGPCVVALFLAIVFIPETYFLRPPVALDGRVLVQSSSEKVQIYGGWDELEAQNGKPLPDIPSAKSFWSHFKVKKAPETSWESWVATYAQMGLCILNPLTFWVSLLSGAMLSGVLFLNLTQLSAIMSEGGDKDERTVNAFLQLSGLIGSVLAIPASGPLATWFLRYYTFRKGGVRHAEIYLALFAIPVVTGLISVLINGLTIMQGWSSSWIYITSALSLISYLTGSVAFTLWITEAFPKWAAAAIAVHLFTSNMTGFGIGTIISPWVEQDNILEPTVLISVLTTVLGAMAVPAAFWGQTVRQYIQGRWSDSERTALRPQ
ncbi:hypothetical protein NW752_005855 [Fusarium irregulare]|uniref:Major facilitator superfamily (MFS) profile domain-containing protein n=1 Tax=Fusarium irregulare TaxID=2494466 RepID=A0A9W8PPT6_9HYPO|nr:hypothetical protein NW766_006387 [Fusarium irregulare]KAJ4018727.1 hypothetical protein NW752_005855 [Fusarium irregulare]